MKLEDDGFVVNHYDPCVVNKEVNGTQMTVTWRVDDLKVSHVNEAEVEKFGNFLKANFEKAKLEVTHHRGPIHDYLGISLDYYDKGKLTVSMIPYLCNVIEGFSERIGTTYASPAADHLFQIQDEKDKKILGKEKAREFYRVTAQLLPQLRGAVGHTDCCVIPNIESQEA